MITNVFQEKRKSSHVGRDRFFLFGPGRARREQPNAGLNLGVRAFVRSVSHVKVLVASFFGLFEKFTSYAEGCHAYAFGSFVEQYAWICIAPSPKSRAVWLFF